MTRKLFSMLLCAFALLLLMGAGIDPQYAATILAEEESAADYVGTALETDIEQSINEVSSQAVPAAASASPLELAELTQSDLMVDGVYASSEVAMIRQGSTSCVALAGMAQELDNTAKIDWNNASGVVTVTTAKLNMTAQVGQLYVVANGRYLYLPEKVQLIDGRVTVPLWAVAKAFDATVGWDSATETVSLTRGSGAIQAGDSYYDQEDLFWLARVIHAESGNQPLKGQMAVGNVVLNRVASPIYPNTVEGVLAQRNQFSTYKSGKLAERTPNASSVLAAKLVLDGGVVAEVDGAMYFDSSSNSWAARNKDYVTTIGNHKFYR